MASSFLGGVDADVCCGAPVDDSSVVDIPKEVGEIQEDKSGCCGLDGLLSVRQEVC